MIKRITGVLHDVSAGPLWLAPSDVADVDVTSEDSALPIENVFASDAPAGWRAAVPGAQTIRLRFRRPVRVTRIRLIFKESEQARTQEFVLRWRSTDALRDLDIVRQQFTFAPPGTTIEHEEYRVDLVDVSALQVSIVPHISGGDALATLQQFCIA
jgi:hypothetical protein